MADEQLIKPRELPAAIAVFSDDAIMTDDGVTVAKATPVQIVDAGAPVPSQSEAIAGVNNSKRMTPLTVRQVLDNTSAPAVLRAQAWAESATTPDPSMPGSKSSRTWALEAAQSASDAEGAASTAATSEENAAISAGQAATSAGQAVAAMAGSVRFDQAQTLTSGQRQQARDNIGLGTVATENVVPLSKGGLGATTAEGARGSIQAARAAVGTTISFEVGAGIVNTNASGGNAYVCGTLKNPAAAWARLFIRASAAVGWSEIGTMNTTTHAAAFGMVPPGWQYKFEGAPLFDVKGVY